MARVQLGDPLRADELDRDVPALDAAAGSRELAQAPRSRSSAGRRGASAAPKTSTSSIAALRRCGSPAGRSAAGARPPVALGVRVVGLDDPLHELVAHDVLAAEAHELDVLDRVEHVADDDQPRLLLARQVDLRDVAR